VFIIIVVIAAVSAYFIVKIQDDLDYLSQMPIVDVDLSLVEDGEYIGEYNSFPVEVTLEVTVVNHTIESIVIIRHSNGQGEDAEAIIATVISEQSIDLDAIAGATYSSKVILLAIKDALK
jgi:uncharacterized protein with FMN-binding domain